MKSAELGEVTSNTAKLINGSKAVILFTNLYHWHPCYNPKDPGHQPHPPSQCPFVRSTLVACQKRDLLNAGAAFSTKGLQKHPLSLLASFKANTKANLNMYKASTNTTDIYRTSKIEANTNKRHSNIDSSGPK